MTRQEKKEGEEMNVVKLDDIHEEWKAKKKLVKLKLVEMDRLDQGSSLGGGCSFSVRYESRYLSVLALKWAMKDTTLLSRLKNGTGTQAEYARWKRERG